MSMLTLMTAADYARELKRKIPAAKKQITIAAMILHWDKETAAYFDLLLHALQRGVKVCLLYDNYATLPFAFNNIVLTAENKRQIHQFTQFTTQFQKAGGEVLVVGKRWSLNPFAGRQHAKITIVDDTVYSFGGVNFSAPHFGFSDLMCRTTDGKLALKLQKLVYKIASAPQVENEHWQLDQKNTVLFDGGTPGASVIYERACELAAKAKEIVFVSQFCPSGRLAELLRPKSRFYFNHSRNTSGVGIVANALAMRRGKIPNSYQRHAYIHAKFILYLMPDGAKVLITGSNNFSWRGVAFGTKEIALASYDSDLWDQFYRFWQTKIAR